MDAVCTVVESFYEQVEDTDRKAELDDILAGLGCYIEEQTNQTLRSGGAGTTDPDQQ